MKESRNATRIIRSVSSLLLIVVGFSTVWAWGEVARLAGPEPVIGEPQTATLYAAWRPEESEQAILFRSLDEGDSWQPLALPQGPAPVLWADDGGDHLAVVREDDSLLRSQDRGDSWVAVTTDLRVVSLAWGDAGNLYLGTDGHGVYLKTADGSLTAIADTEGALASAQVVNLAVVEGRLFALTPTVLFYTDETGKDGDETWVESLPIPEWATALVATDRETVYVGTATVGVYRSSDAGQSWQPAWEGLGLAAGQMVKITALRADPQEPDLLYAAVDHVVGSTQVHASAAGTYVTLDRGGSWQALAGPSFPEAVHASSLIVTAGNPLYVQAVTASGLQSYEPDVVGALAALESDDPRTRADAARVLGLARAQEAGGALLAALDDPDPAVILAVADALGQIDDPATVSGLLVALEHPGELVRLGAARALGRMGVEAAVKPLRAMLLNGEGLEVSVAGEALGQIGSPAATGALLVALADPVPTPRWQAAMGALEVMGEPAVGLLVEMVDSRDAYARSRAAEALGWIGSPSATGPLVDALEDEDATVRGQAAWALGEIGDPAARAALERARSRDPEARVQTEAASALSRLREEPVEVARWPASWAPTLSRLQAMRWLVLVLSLAGAAWLMVGIRPLSPVLLRRRIR